MGRSFLSVIKVVRNIVEALELLYGVLVVQALTEDIVNDMMPSRYLPEQSRLSHVR